MTAEDVERLLDQINYLHTRVELVDAALDRVRAEISRWPSSAERYAAAVRAVIEADR